MISPAVIIQSISKDKGINKTDKSKTHNSKKHYPAFDELLGRRIKDWRAEEIIGKGTFGIIYKCSKTITTRSGKPFKIYSALKAEVFDKDQPPSMKELQILQILQTSARCTDFFAQVYEYGEKRKFIYVITTLFHKSLFDILVESPQKKIEKRTWIRVMKNVFDGIQILHSLGIIHLDLKPANIMVAGKDPSKRGTILARIIDFGLSKYVKYGYKEDPVPLGPETEIQINEGDNPVWIGSIFHCSPFIHKGCKPTFRDDILSWFYIAMDLYKELPWGPADTEQEIVKKKLENNFTYFHKNLPKEFGKIINLIEKVEKYAPPRYSSFNKELDNVLKYLKIEWSEVCQWETGFDLKKAEEHSMKIDMDASKIPETLKSRMTEDNAPAIRISVTNPDKIKDDTKNLKISKKRKKESLKGSSRRRHRRTKTVTTEQKVETEGIE